MAEALPDASNVGMARTLTVVRNGRVPVRLCNPHPYSLSIGQYEKLGKLCHIDDIDVHGPRDLSLSLEEDGAVKVALVDATLNPGQRELPQDTNPHCFQTMKGKCRFPLPMPWFDAADAFGPLLDKY